MGPMEYMGEHKKGIAAGTAAVLLVGAGALAAVRYDSGEPTSNDDRAAADELRELLTVETVSVDCDTVVKETGIGEVVTRGEGTYIVPDIGALKPVAFGTPEVRQWGDALSTPFVSPEADKDALLKELQATLCEDALLADTFANMFANMEVDEVKLVDINPWLKEYEGDAGIINDKANETVISPEDPQAAYDEQQELAELLGTLLTRFQNNGVQEMGPTTFNYNLLAGGVMVVADGLPEVALNATQFETAKGLTLVVTKKDGECLKTIMINIGDKRPEGIDENCIVPTPEVPVETVPEDTTPNTGGPTTTGGSVTTTIPGVTVTTGNTTSTRPELETPGPDGITEPGVGGQPEDNPNNNTTTSTTIRPATSTTTQAPVPTITQPPTTNTTVIAG